MKANLITLRQALALKELGFNEPVSNYYDFLCEEIVCNEFPSNRNYTLWDGKLMSVPTVDEAIDWFRRKFDIQIYAAIEPFVDPTNNSAPILHRYTVKLCDRKNGWNGRRYLGKSRLTKNIYSAKRECILLAIKYLQRKS